PSRKPLKLSAPLRPVSPATSWNVAVLATVSACNQEESTTGAAAAGAPCAHAATGTTTRGKMDRNLTIRASLEGRSPTRSPAASPSATKIRSRCGRRGEGTRKELHACLRQPEHEQRVAQRIADLEVAT